MHWLAWTGIGVGVFALLVLTYGVLVVAGLNKQGRRTVQTTVSPRLTDLAERVEALEGIERKRRLELEALVTELEKRHKQYQGWFGAQGGRPRRSSSSEDDDELEDARVELDPQDKAQLAFFAQHAAPPVVEDAAYREGVRQSAVSPERQIASRRSGRPPLEPIS